MMRFSTIDCVNISFNFFVTDELHIDKKSEECHTVVFAPPPQQPSSPSVGLRKRKRKRVKKTDDAGLLDDFSTWQ